MPELDVFEAFGLTAEWDSATVCVSLLLTQLWEHFPEFQAAKTGDCRPPAHHHLPLPDFQAFIAGLPAQVAGQSSALAAAEEGLLRRSSFLSAGQRELLQDLLGSTRLFERSPIHRLIQEFNLGSQGFTEIYGMQPSLAIESTLLMYDRPRLDDADRRLLGNWANDPDHRAVIFTKELLTEEIEPDSAAQVRFWTTRTQLRQLARWGQDVASRGRPVCPQCGQPMEPEGHFCPKKNGHLH